MMFIKFSFISKFSFLVLLIYITSSAFALAELDEDSQELWSEAQALYYQKRYDKALEAFNELNEKYPQEVKFELLLTNSLAELLKAKVWLERAKKLIELKRYNHALEAIKYAKQVFPFEEEVSKYYDTIQDIKTSHQPLADLNQSQKTIFDQSIENAEKKLKTGDYEAALKLYAKALEIASESTIALEGYSEAQKRLLVSQNQNKIKRLLKTAAKLESLSKLIEAKAAYESVLRLDPGNQKSLKSVLLLQKEIEEKRLLSQKRSLADQYFKTAKRNLKNKEFDSAIEQYELGRETLPDYTNWNKLILKASIAKEKAKRKREEKIRNKIDRDYRKGIAFLITEKFKEAISAFQSVLKSSKELNITSIIEPTEELLKKSKKALQTQEEEVVNKESPYYELVQSLKALGIRQLELGNFESAKKYFEKILDLFPHNRFANQNILVCRIKLEPGLSGQITLDFISEIKSSLRQKDYSKARRLLDIVRYIDSENTEIKKLKSRIDKLTAIFTQNKSTAEINNLWQKALRAQQTNNREVAINLAKRILIADPRHLNSRRLLTRLEGGGITQRTNIQIPKRAKRAYAQGILYYNNGSVPEAIKFFQLAVNIFPAYTKANIALTKCKRYTNLR